MAQICSVMAVSHSPFLYVAPEEWEAARAARAAVRESNPDLPPVPADSPESNAAKHAACMAAFAELKRQLDEARPDVIVIFGDDQKEQFDFTTMPPIGVYVGADFEGYKISQWIGLPVPGVQRQARDQSPEHWATVKGHPELGRELMKGLMRRGFDPAFLDGLPRPDDGMSHAFMRPLLYLRPDFDVPVVPIFVNCFYGPQPSGARCYDLGHAVREIIEEFPAGLRVAVIGSGGLWHTPMDPAATIDTGFDAAVLRAVETGDARTVADVFDAVHPEVTPGDERAIRLHSGGTMMAVGIGSGTGETRNWVAAAAVADGVPGTVLASVDIWASPIGVAFASWDMTG
jgi:aromatic ring-opening dioxygenase catalytic subunit (LigB family)